MPNLHDAYVKIMERARATNAHRDRIERAIKGPLPRDCGPAIYLAAAISAIETGVIVRDWDAVAEGLAMLEDLRMKYALVLGGKRASRQPTSAFSSDGN